MNLNNWIELWVFWFIDSIFGRPWLLTLLNAIFNRLLLNTLWANATFTRSTTATVKDFEWVIKTANIDEIRFEWARRVENLFKTIDSNIALWPDWVTMNASRIVPTSTDANIAQNITFNPASRSFTMSIWIYWDASSTWKNAAFLIYWWPWVLELATLSFTIQSGWNRYSWTHTFTSWLVATYVKWRMDLLNPSAIWENTIFTQMQFEEVTGQANTNPSEYVSKDVATWIELNPNPGNPFINTNTYSTTNSTLSVVWWAMRVTTTTTSEWKASQAWIATVIGKTYIFKVSHIWGTAGWKAYISTILWSNDIFSSTSNWLIAWTYFHSFVATTAITYVSVVCNTAAWAGMYTDFTEVSLREADHWANIDWVKYFNYENWNTVSWNEVIETVWPTISPSITKWVLIEPQVTNLLFSSENLNDWRWLKWPWWTITTLSWWMNLTNDTSITSYNYVIRTVIISAVDWFCIASMLIKKWTQSADNIPEIKYVNTTGANDWTERSVQLNPATGAVITRLNWTSYWVPIEWTDYWVIDEWNFYRLWIKWITRTLSSVSTISIWPSVTNVANFWGTTVVATGSIELWKLQLELWSIIHNYVPALTVGTTKSVDNLSYSTITPTKDVSYIFDFTPYADWINYWWNNILFWTRDIRWTSKEIRVNFWTNYIIWAVYFTLKQSDIIKWVTTKIWLSYKQVWNNIVWNIVKDWVLVYTNTFIWTIDHSNQNILWIWYWRWQSISWDIKNFKMYNKWL